MDRPLILPLPSGPGISPAAAANFFANDPKGKIIAARHENEHIRILLAAANACSLGPDGEEAFTQIYNAYLRESEPGLMRSKWLWSNSENGVKSRHWAFCGDGIGAFAS